MLKLFEVKNYKNFKEKITIDFSNIGGYQFNTECINNQTIGKMLIYGRNATGKTNLGKAIFDVIKNLSTARYFFSQNGIYLNADSKENYSDFKYVFQFNQDEVIYRYKKISEMQLYDEEILLNGKRGFYYNFDTKDSDFENLKILDADTVIIERYLQAMNRNEEEEDEANYTLSFLRWLINNTALAADSILLKLNDYIDRMAMVTVGNTMMPRNVRVKDSFFERLADEEVLGDFEEFLNIMGIECKLIIKELPDGQNELYFNHDRLVPFIQTASSGTLALMNLYRRFEIGKTASIMYIDEFDAFYHYEMAEKVVGFFKKKYLNCQVIMTTHNTNLMTNRLMRPDCLFILSRKGTITALRDATPRELREGHNLEKLYISGEFEEYE